MVAEFVPHVSDVDVDKVFVLCLRDGCWLAAYRAKGTGCPARTPIDASSKCPRRCCCGASRPDRWRAVPGRHPRPTVRPRRDRRTYLHDAAGGAHPQPRSSRSSLSRSACIRCREAGVDRIGADHGSPTLAGLAAGRRSRLRVKALTATMRLEPAMESAATSGRRVRPKTGSRAPAAIGRAMVL